MAGRFLRSKQLGLVWLDQETVDALARELEDELTAQQTRARTALHALAVETDLGPAVLDRQIDHVLTGGAP